MLLRGVDSTVDLLVVLMVGVVLVDICYFVDPLVGLLRVLRGVGLPFFSRSSNSLTPSSCISPGSVFPGPHSHRPLPPKP